MKVIEGKHHTGAAEVPAAALPENYSNPTPMTPKETNVIWDAKVTYSQGQLVTRGQYAYISRIANNLNNDPNVAPAQGGIDKGAAWRSLGIRTGADITSDITMDYYRTAQRHLEIRGAYNITLPLASLMNDGDEVIFDFTASSGVVDIIPSGSDVIVEGTTISTNAAPLAIAINSRVHLGCHQAGWFVKNRSVGIATETAMGLVELATQSEVDTGTDTTRVLTPKTAKVAMTNHENSRNHPDASETEKGFVELANLAEIEAGSEVAKVLAVKAFTDFILGQLPKKAKSIGPNVDLDTMKTPGIFYQASNADAASGSNYPADMAGALLIFKHAGICQIYITYQADASRRIHYRNFYGEAPPSIWTTLFDSNNKPTPADVRAVEDILLGATAVGTKKDRSWIGFGIGDGDLPNPQNDFGTVTVSAGGSKGLYQLLFDGTSISDKTNLKIYARGVDADNANEDIATSKHVELFHTGNPPNANEIDGLQEALEEASTKPVWISVPSLSSSATWGVMTLPKPLGNTDIITIEVPEIKLFAAAGQPPSGEGGSGTSPEDADGRLTVNGMVLMDKSAHGSTNASDSYYHAGVRTFVVSKHAELINATTLTFVIEFSGDGSCTATAGEIIVTYI